MRDIIEPVVAVFLVIAVVFGFVWIIEGNDFFLFKVFAPKYEQVRRETFEQSKAYNQGVIQELDTLYMEYQRGSDVQKAAIADVARHRVADYPVEQLPPHLRAFVAEVRR